MPKVLRAIGPMGASAMARTAANGGSGTAAHDCSRACCEPTEQPKYTVSRRVTRSARAESYDRTPGDPLHRPLRIYTVDPGTGRDDGPTAVVNVPYEPVHKGPKGSVFHVLPVLVHPAREEAEEEQQQQQAQGKKVKVRDSIDLDDPSLLLTNGRTPSPVDPFFHQQMVYAVASLVYASFRRALGRHVAWGFDPEKRKSKDTRLRLDPHGRRGQAGASYDREGGIIRFGFVKTESNVGGRAVPDGHTFSCVSHDIITHEVTHALLDGLRAHFLEPTSADVLGFHEGFADVIALLHHFSYQEVVRAAVRRSRGKVLQAALMTSIATEFGLSIGNGGPLRSLEMTMAKAAMEVTMARAATADGKPADPEDVIPTYSEDMGPHEMGEVFVSAVIHALSTVYTRKTERYLRLATGGTGVLQPGDISSDLQDVLVEEASQLATQFLNLCIRAIDYCPPVDLQLGEFLRAVITADQDLVPDDPWGYREAWIEAFALHRIYPRGVQSMCEDELRWPFIPPPKQDEDEEQEDADPSQKGLKVEGLSFNDLAFNGGPGSPADPGELQRQAEALGEFVTRDADSLKRFGLVAPDDPLLAGDEVTVPEVRSIRPSRRVGPDGQMVFDLVAEVTQTRKVKPPQSEFATRESKGFLFRGGSTIILGPQGEVRYIIQKSVAQNSRVFRQRKFMLGKGQEFVSTAEVGFEEIADVEGFRMPDAQSVQFAHQHGAAARRNDAHSH